jgi:hypothetical protein
MRSPLQRRSSVEHRRQGLVDLVTNVLVDGDNVSRMCEQGCATVTKVSGTSVTNVSGLYRCLAAERFNRSREGATTVASGSTAQKRRARVGRTGLTALQLRASRARAVKPHRPTRQNRYSAVKPPVSMPQWPRRSGSTAPSGPRCKHDERVDAQNTTRADQGADQPLRLVSRPTCAFTCDRHEAKHLAPRVGG